MFKKFLCSIAALGALALVAQGEANAATIHIGASATAAPPPVAVSSNTGTAFFSTGVTPVNGITFTVVSNGLGSPSVTGSLLLDTLALDSASVSGGDAYLFVTQTDITAPLGNLSFITAFTDNLLPAGWTATATTYFNQDNSVFGLNTLLTPTPLAFNGPCQFLTPCASQSATQSVFNVNAPYSITQVLHIEASGAGSANQIIDVSAVPGPIVGAGLPGLIAACGGLLALARRRRKQAL